MAKATFRIWRGEGTGGEFVDYHAEVSEGMVVLDAVHQIQATQANDLACRWNCKAGKCGSCSAEINGMPRLMCMTRLNDLDLDQPVTIEPMRAFPPVRDLVTDVSWNFRVKKQIKPFKPRKPDIRMGHGPWPRRTWTGCRNFASASNVSVPGCLPCSARPSNAGPIHRPAIFCLHGGAGNASAGYRGPHA